MKRGGSMPSIFRNNAVVAGKKTVKPEEEEKILELLARILDMMIIICTKDGRITYVSPNIDILGYVRNEALGKTLDELFNHPPQKSLQILPRGDETVKRLSRFSKKDGSFIWMVINASRLRDEEENREYGYVVTLREISLDTMESLQQRDKLSALGQLAAGIAHEIKNPLTSMKGFIQIMKADRKYNEEYLKIMELELERLESISQELMCFAKPNKNQWKVCNLGAILEKSIALLEGDIFRKRIQVIFHRDEEPIPVFCDEQKIKQVFINLIKNAMEATESQGKIIIKASKEKESAVITVTDTGCGIPEELMNRIGQPFFTTKENGNGLGLMMCNKIIAEHNGSISVRSKMGVGTTFAVTLPIFRDQG
ncbi:MAG: hypothetical protein C6W57_09290 [Caldibacillus debilis]|nr:MAG: hypothetical protein C6W57_09290 [Caldibacillus debilis]